MLAELVDLLVFKHHSPEEAKDWIYKEQRCQSIRGKVTMLRKYHIVEVDHGLRKIDALAMHRGIASNCSSRTQDCIQTYHLAHLYLLQF